MKNKNEESEVVKVNVKKHTAEITGRNVVKVNHHKQCAKPCVRVDEILEYLEAELFVDEGYVVTGER